MQIVHIADTTKLNTTVARYIFDRIKSNLHQNRPFTLGLATGSTPLGIYRELVPLLGASGLDLSGFYTFNLDEYIGLTQHHPNSYHAEMMTNFWLPLQKLNPTFKLEHTHIPDTSTQNPDEECKTYEHAIQKNGGIDLQILGIGTNGHIAFNEPGSRGDSRTRVVSINEETRKVNADKFFAGDISKVPTHAISMGIGTILEAREIVLIALGESKREIMTRLLNLVEPTENIPASFLLQHKNTKIYTDMSNM